MMSDLFLFPNAVKRDPEVEAWFAERDDTLGRIAKTSFERMRRCGKDVRELLHDGHPTAEAHDRIAAYVVSGIFRE